VLPSFPSTGIKEVVGAVCTGGAGNGAADYWLIPLLGSLGGAHQEGERPPRERGNAELGEKMDLHTQT